MWEILLLFLLLAIGIFLVIKGGDIIVDVCTKISDITGINDVLIGSTIVSLATTMPELTITILGMSQNSSGLVIGNGFGTILVNMCVVLGLALCSISLKRVGKQTLSKLIFMVIMVIVLSVFAILKLLNVFVGIIFLLVFLFYFIKTFIDIKNDLIKSNKIENVNSLKKVHATVKDKILFILKFIVGTLIIFSGAQIIINSTNSLSQLLNISSTFIGLTFVAIGTSLPELVTTIASIKKRRLNLALGNIIGSNIINLTLLFSMAMIMSGAEGIALSLNNIITLLPAVIISSLILSLPIFINKRTYKWQGYLLLSLYAIYCIIIIFTI